jgi:hypothetical protein
MFLASLTMADIVDHHAMAQNKSRIPFALPSQHPTDLLAEIRATDFTTTSYFRQFRPGTKMRRVLFLFQATWNRSVDRCTYVVHVTIPVQNQQSDDRDT